jgi:hypothetical protein
MWLCRLWRTVLDVIWVRLLSAVHMLSPSALCLSPAAPR